LSWGTAKFTFVWRPHYGKKKFLQNSAGNCPKHGGLAIPPFLGADVMGHDSEETADIYQLQAAFHLAKSTQNIDLLMSLWDPNGSLTIPGNPESPFVGYAAIKAFLLTTGSFTHLRFSLVPSFKIKIAIHGDSAFFYEECHDVANFDQPTRSIAADSYLAGTVRKIRGRWLFSDMFGGSASPLSVDHYSFP
jgi:hypothetical protein